jgi:hypothetical protein
MALVALKRKDHAAILRILGELRPWSTVQHGKLELLTGAHPLCTQVRTLKWKSVSLIMVEEIVSQIQNWDSP